MAYTINLTNGGVYATIPDGQINEATDALTLVGKNFTGYGENIGENFVHLLENSADATFPGDALTGQLWFDTAAGVLKVYAGNLAGWKSLGGTASTATEPSADKSEAGDIWFDTATEQTYIYNSTEYILINQVGPVSAGETGPISTNNDGHEIVEYWVNGELVAIMSKDASFTPNPAITGFAQIAPGFQLSSTVSSGNAVFTGTATNALSLDGSGPEDFLSASSNDTTSGTLGIVNDGGLTFGLDNDGRLKVTGNDVILSNVTSTGDMVFEVWNGGAIQAITIDGTTGHATVPNVPVDGLDIANRNYVVSALTSDILAGNIPLEDTGAYYTTDDVESAFQEVGADLLLKGDIDGQTFTNTTLTSPTINTSISGTAIDTDITLSASSDTLLATQKAIKAYVDSQLTTHFLPTYTEVSLVRNQLNLPTNYCGICPLTPTRIAMVCPDPTYALRAYELDLETGNWTLDGISLGIANLGDAIAAISDTDVAVVVNGNVQRYTFNGGWWTSVGSAFTPTGVIRVMAAMDSTHIATYDSNNDVVRVLEYSGSSWTEVASLSHGASPGQYPSMSSFNATDLLLAVNGNLVSVVRYDGASTLSVVHQDTSFTLIVPKLTAINSTDFVLIPANGYAVEIYRFDETASSFTLLYTGLVPPDSAAGNSIVPLNTTEFAIVLLNYMKNYKIERYIGEDSPIPFK